MEAEIESRGLERVSRFLAAAVVGLTMGTAAVLLAVLLKLAF